MAANECFYILNKPKMIGDREIRAKIKEAEKAVVYRLKNGDLIDEPNIVGALFDGICSQMTDSHMGLRFRHHKSRELEPLTGADGSLIYTDDNKIFKYALIQAKNNTGGKFLKFKPSDIVQGQKMLDITSDSFFLILHYDFKLIPAFHATKDILIKNLDKMALSEFLLKFICCYIGDHHVNNLPRLLNDKIGMKYGSIYGIKNAILGDDMILTKNDLIITKSNEG